MSLAEKKVVVSFDAVAKAWADTRSRPIWIVGNAVLLAISMGFTYLERSLFMPQNESRLVYGGLLSLAATITSTLLMATYQREYLKHLRGEKPMLLGIFNTAMLEGKFIVLGTILYLPSLILWVIQNTLVHDPATQTLLYGFGYLAIWVVMFPLCFSRLILIDQGVSVVEAMRSSWRFTMRAPGAILWMLILAGFTSLLGAIACGVGYLVTAPIYLLAMTILYEENRQAGLIEIK